MPRMAQDLHWDKNKKFIPNGSNTLSKCPERFVNGVYPKLVKWAEGCTLEDIEGHCYTDFLSAFGPIILGYQNRAVDKAVRAQMMEGTIYSLPSHKEGDLARSLNAHIPSAEKVKFFKTGSDACTAAIKVARAVTGKDRIIACGYHGMHDWYTASTDNKRGIPAHNSSLITKFKYNDLESLLEAFHTDDVAAVIMEPCVYDEPIDDFLNKVKEICRTHGALFILDEVVTGFRMHIGGAQSLFKVVPDLSTFSKAMGNGYPIAALVGKAEYMDVWEQPGFFLSGTFGGDLVGIAAANQTIKELDSTDCFLMKRIWRVGNKLKDGFNEAVEARALEGVRCKGYGPRTTFEWPSLEHKALFMQEMCRKGRLFGAVNFVNASHTDALMDSVLVDINEVIDMMKKHWKDPKAMLDGEMPKEVIIR